MRSPLSGLAPARRRLVVISLGILAVALVTVIGTFTVTELNGGSPADQSRLGPVIVVPGYGGGMDDLAPLIAELRQEGREAVPFVPTEGGTGDLRVQARRLGELAERTLSRTGDDSVDVIGYSAGGVVVRLWIRDNDGASVVRRVLTLGSPHHGSDVAALAADVAGGCPTACEQLATGSDLLRPRRAGRTRLGRGADRQRRDRDAERLRRARRRTQHQGAGSVPDCDHLARGAPERSGGASNLGQRPGSTGASSACGRHLLMSLVAKFAQAAVANTAR